jgi:hypothetical protein
MLYCRFCGSELPVNARFCGRCGSVLGAATEGRTDLSSSPEQDVQSAGSYAEDSQAVLFDLPFAAGWPGDLQTPMANAPMVKGTPQSGGTPIVHGTPSTPNTLPGQSLDQGALPPHHLHSPQHSTEPFHQMHPPHHRIESSPPHQVRQPRPSPIHHRQTGSLHPPTHPPYRSPHHRRAHRHPRSRIVGWSLIGLSCLIIIAGGISALFILFSPTPSLSLSGSGHVLSGGLIHLHGKGFTPGGSVALSLDGSIALTAQQLGTTGPERYDTQADAASALGILAAQQLYLPTASNGTIHVRSDGTFDVVTVADSHWSLGSHTIHAVELASSHSAVLPITIVAGPAQLSVRPTSLDLGNLQMSTKVIVAVEVGNTGGQRLTWTADTKGTLGISVQTRTGTIAPGSLYQFIHVVVDTTHLKVGDYSTILRISSNAGEAQVRIKFKIILPLPKKQAKLAISRASLDFGTWQVGNQVMLQMAVSNLGTQRLAWKVDAGIAHWLTLDKNAGTIEPGGLPQTIYVTADTTRLPAGNYSALLYISSNGGNAQIGATIVVTPQPQPPTPPTTNPIQPRLKVDPARFNANTDCSYTHGQGWICLAILSSARDAQRNLDWSASGSGLSGITFFPSHLTLAPGDSVGVNVIIPDTKCHATATLTFRGPANTVQVPWSCEPWPTTLIVIPMTFDAYTDCSSDNNNHRDWHCPATLISDPGNQADLNWSASGSGDGRPTFSPSGGTLSPGQQMDVTITLDTTCPASAHFTFTGGASPRTALWNCEPVKLIIDPDHFSNQSCPYTDGGWTCTAMLRSDNNARGNLDWSASASSNLPDVTFTPSSGTVSVGQSVPVSIFVPNGDCEDGTFNFAGPADPLTVPWSCTQPPILKVSQSSIDANTDCTYKEGWTCTLMLGSDQKAKADLNWSAASSGISGISFSPSNGSLSPGQQVPVTITVPSASCPAPTTSLTFSGGAQPVTVPWSCSPPTLAVNPNTFNTPDPHCSYTPPSADPGGWSCTETLSLAHPGDPDLNWSTPASLGGSGAVQYNPSSGTLSAGQKTPVTVTIADMVCPASITFSFLASAGNALDVPWACAAPMLTVPTSQSNCTTDNNGNLVCSDTLALALGSQGDLNWSASAGSDLPGATFNPPNGTLAPGQPVQVTVAVPAGDCPTGHYSYTAVGDAANAVSVTWNCPATPTAAPTDTPTPSQSSILVFPLVLVVGLGSFCWNTTRMRCHRTKRFRGRLLRSLRERIRRFE